MTQLATRNGNGGAITKPVNPRFQNEEPEDVILPRAHLYQGLPAEAEQYGDGFKPGDIINQLTGEKIKSRKFTPILAWNQWTKWKEPRGSGIEYTLRNKRDVPPEDLEWDREGGKPPVAQQSMNFVVLFDGLDTPLVLSFKSKSLKAGRSLNSIEKIRGARGPGFYELQTKKEQNAKGTFLVPVIRPIGDPPKALKEAADGFFASMGGAQVEVAGEDVEPDFDPDAQ